MGRGRTAVDRIADEMPPGIENAKELDGDKKIYHVKVIQCVTEGCPSVLRLKLSPILPVAGVFKAVQKHGWETSVNKGCVCPACQETRRLAKSSRATDTDQPEPSNVINIEEAKAMPAVQQPSQPSAPVMNLANDMLLHVEVAKLLSDHFVKEAGTFDKGWSDQVISERTGCHIEVVKKIREAAFGKLSTPDEVIDMLKELAKVSGEVDTARALMAEYDTSLKTTESQIRAELDRVVGLRAEVKTALELIGTLHRKVVGDLSKRVDGIVVKYR